MIKSIALIFPLTLLSCTSTLPGADYRADLRNVCEHPVQVDVPRYAWEHGYEPLVKGLNPGDSTIVLNIGCEACSGLFTNCSDPVDNLKKCLPDDYKMTISSHIINNLTKANLLEMLKQAEYVQKEKNVIYYWIISDPSLCPKP